MFCYETKRERRKISVCLSDVIFDYDWLIATQLFNVFIKQRAKSEKEKDLQKKKEDRDDCLRHGQMNFCFPFNNRN